MGKESKVILTPFAAHTLNAERPGLFPDSGKGNRSESDAGLPKNSDFTLSKRHTLQTAGSTYLICLVNCLFEMPSLVPEGSIKTFTDAVNSNADRR